MYATHSRTAPNLKITKSTEFPPNFAESVLNVQKEYQIYGFSWVLQNEFEKI